LDITSSLLNKRSESEFDVVSNVICPLCEPVIKGAGAVIILVRMPVDAPPSMLLSERDERNHEHPPCTAAPRFRHDEEILKIADRLETPGMGVKDIIGEPNWFAVETAGDEAPDRLIRRQNALPDALRDRVRNRAVKCRAVSAPEREPSLGVRRSNRTNIQWC